MFGIAKATIGETDRRNCNGKRKLTTILAADVVGYSALMEDATRRELIERLKAGRKELFEPEIARHRGRVFKLMGDGLYRRVRLLLSTRSNAR